MVRPATPALIFSARPTLGSALELLKPITWFPPMWAFGCGLVSGGAVLPRQFDLVFGGVLLAGPLLCGASQAVNEWFDRHVDAVNEPDRPIPSGRIPGHWGLGMAVGMTGLALVVAAAFGMWVLVPAALGSALSWAYSAPPLRLKRNGWWGNASVALAYEGLAWLAGAAAAAGAAPGWRTVVTALVYSLGAHGIMTLNDFKSVEGDTRTGVGSLPVRLGPPAAARLACATMGCSQALVIVLLVAWQRPIHAIVIGIALLAQFALMPRFLADPRGGAARYNATGTGLFVIGMMVAAAALRSAGVSA